MRWIHRQELRLAGESRILEDRLTALDQSTNSAIHGLVDLAKKVETVSVSVDKLGKSTMDASSYQIRLAYVSIVASISASLFAAIAAIGSILNRNSTMFFVASAALFLAAAFLWVKLAGAVFSQK